MSKRYAEDFDPSTLVVERCIYSNAVEELKETRRERDALKDKCAELEGAAVDLYLVEETLDATVDINSQLTTERDALKAKCAELEEIMMQVASADTKTEANTIASSIIDKNPATCLADIEARAVERFAEWHFAGSDSIDTNGRKFAKEYADNLRQQAGE